MGLFKKSLPQLTTQLRLWANIQRVCWCGTYELQLKKLWKWLEELRWVAFVHRRLEFDEFDYKHFIEVIIGVENVNVYVFRTSFKDATRYTNFAGTSVYFD